MTEKEFKKDKKTFGKSVVDHIKFYHILLCLIVLSLLNLTSLVFAAYKSLPDLPLEKNSFNVLVLGASGGERVGSDLTDTIILANVDLSKRKVSLISIPRDLWIDPLKTKINALYHYGGFEMIEENVFEITGQKPLFSVLLDFQGFKKAIDMIGGIEVNVENSFDDYKYPVEDENGIPVDNGEIYEHIHFEKGLRVMDGENALKYARSRNSEDELEAGDDARSKRQQKVIIAFKDKLLDPKVLTNQQILAGLLEIGKEHIKSNFTQEQLLGFLKISYKFLKVNSFSSYSLASDYDSTDSLLINPPISKHGQWVLEPRSGDWNKTKSFILQVLNE